MIKTTYHLNAGRPKTAAIIERIKTAGISHRIQNKNGVFIVDIYQTPAQVERANGNLWAK
jgi:hypothetical protein